MVWALVADGMLALPRILRAAFVHPWVASYQVGFGPPLVRATDRLTERVREARTAMEKLDAYLEHCILDAEECARLATLQRRLLVRRRGPVEAEELDAASADALDLSLRLHAPATAPRKAKETMAKAGIPLDLVPPNTAPDQLTGRFLVRLSDPRNGRLLHIPAVADAAEGDLDHALALELRASVAYRELWSTFLEVLSLVAPFRPVPVGAPAAHARVLRNGERI